MRSRSPPVAEFIDAYAVLGVAPDATQDALKAAHRRLVRRHHPDLAAPAERDAATRRIQDINVAYGLVRDPQARARYDRIRRVQRTRTVPSEVDRALAEQWETLVVAAGRWAASWKVRGSRQARRAARRARRAGLGALGRVIWLTLSGLGLVVGFLVALAAQRLVGVDGYVTPLVGISAGALAGSQRGWHQRLRLAGVIVEPAARRWGTTVAFLSIAAGLWVDARLSG